MQPFPHHYSVQAQANCTGNIDLRSAGLPSLESAAPAEFDGPGDQWSPETLLTVAIAGCFILTFRAVARASKLEWSRLQCAVAGTLDRADGSTRFVQFHIRANLTVPAGTRESLAKRALEKAEKGCLVTNSLTTPVELETTVEAE